MYEREIPELWQWARFGDVAIIESNLVDPSEYQDSPHVAPNHIESCTGVLLPYATVRFDKVISPKHLFVPGQILYSKIRPYLAKAVVVNFSGLCSADMYPVSTKLDASYLHRWLVSPEFTALVSENQGRTLLPKINQDALVELPVPVPPLAEQRRIVAKVEALTAKSRRAKEELDAIPALLERLRQSMLAATFRGDLTADWREKNPDVEPAEELLKRVRAERRRRWEEAELAKMRAKGKVPGDDRWKEKYEEPAPVDASELPELPEGWCWTTIETVGHLLLGRRRAPEYVEGQDGRVLRPYLRVANVKEDRLDLSDVLRMPFSDEELSLYRLCSGDIILSEGQSPELVGQSAIYGGGYDDLCIQATVHRFRAYDGIAVQYAQLVFLHHLRMGIFQRAASLTTNIAHLTSERLRPLPFPLAPVAEQIEIVRCARRALDSSAVILQRLNEARIGIVRQGQSILAKAFRGELVPQDPNDEPASVLLERLQAEREQNGKPTNGSTRRRAATSSSPARPDNTPAKRPHASRRSQAPARSRG